MGRVSTVRAHQLEQGSYTWDVWAPTFSKILLPPLLLPLPLPPAPPSLPLAGRRRCQPWSLLVPHRPLAFVMLIPVDISCGPKPLNPRPLCPIDPSRSSRSTKERRSSGLRRGPCNRLFPVWDVQRRFTGSCGFSFSGACCWGFEGMSIPKLPQSMPGITMHRVLVVTRAPNSQSL